VGQPDVTAVIRKLQPNWNRPACLGLAAVTALWTGFATLISTDGKFSDGFGQGYGGFWITAIILLLFVGLYRVNPGEKVSKLLGWLSGGVFEGYLLSRLLDVWIYNTVPQWHTPAMYPVILVCITVPVFIVSILAGKLLHELALRICRPAARSRKGKFAAK
jgi:surface polysaccharide O-acyltransferase-like enzyme